jgi:TIGR03009 family protein
MRKWWWTLLMMGVSGPALIAQQPATPGASPTQSLPPVTLNPTTNRLDAILLSWEQAMKPIQAASAQCIHTVVDKVLKDTEVYEGTAHFMKPDLAIIDLKMKGRPQDVEHVICTGTFVYQFVPANQVIKVFDLKAGQSNQDNFVPFLQGMKAQDAKTRYELTLVKEDNNYIYIKIVPRLLIDKADFREARLVLWSQTLLPRELRFVGPDGKENIWDIPKIEANPGTLNRTVFTAPKLPAGWKWEKAPVLPNPTPRSDVPPRVFRPKQ